LFKQLLTNDFIELKKTSLLVILLIAALSPLLAQGGATEQKLKLAETYEKSGDLTNASRIYEELFNANPKKDEYFWGIVRTYKALSQYGALMPYIDKKLKSAETTDLLALKSEILWRIGKTNEAIDLWNSILEKNSKSLDAYEQVAYAQIGVQLFEKAAATYQKARQALGQDNLFTDELSQLYIAFGDYEKGTTEVIKLFEETGNYSIAQGRLQAMMSNKESISFIKNVIEKKVAQQRNPLYYRLMGWFLRVVGELEQAYSAYIKLDELTGANGKEILAFADLSRRDKQYEIALKAYGYIIDKGKESPFVQNALYGYARTLETRFREDKDLPASFLDTIISRYKHIQKLFPNTNTADDCKLRIALIQIEHLRNYYAAEQELSGLAEKKSAPALAAQANNLIGDIYLMRDSLEYARQIFSKVIKNYAKNAPNEVLKAKFRIAQIEFYEGNYDTASARFAEVSVVPNSEYSNDAIQTVAFIEQNKNLFKGIEVYAQSQLRMFQGRTEETLKLLRDCTKLGYKADLGELAFLEIARLETSLGRLDSVIATVDTLFSQMPETIYGDECLLLKASALAKKGQNDQAIKAYTEILTKYPRSIYLAEAEAKLENFVLSNK
jgi:tetratricopeptide (TPR) repeat protein